MSATMLVPRPSPLHLRVSTRALASDRHITASVISPLWNRQFHNCKTICRSRCRLQARAKMLRLTASTRTKSTWGYRTSFLAGGRFASSLHRSDCTWIRATGDPRSNPRDKNCPQCQKEAALPEILSHREIMWQRHAEFWKEFLEKDPYEALFGRSNKALRGRSWTPKFIWDRDIRPGKHRAEVYKTQPCQPSEEPQKPSPTRPETSDSKTRGPLESSQQEQSKFQGYGKWSYRSTDGFGKTIEESRGEYVFDPISMRMIPSEVTSSNIEGGKSSRTLQQPGSASPELAGKMTAINEERTKPYNPLSREEKQPRNHGRVETAVPGEESHSPSTSKLLTTKHALEKSWRSQQYPQHAPPRQSSSPAPWKTDIPKHDNTIMNARRTIHLRDRPLKYMANRELNQHRQFLVKLFERKQNKKTHPTAAETRLDEEVAAMKTKMAAHESRQMSTSRPVEHQAVIPQPKASETITSAGEGDLCPNAVNYATESRWYKKKAPHAFETAQLSVQEQDEKLVQDIRDIYEETYGPINPPRSEADISRSQEADRSSKSSPKSMHSEQQASNEDLKNVISRLSQQLEKQQERITFLETSQTGKTIEDPARRGVNKIGQQEVPRASHTPKEDTRTTFSGEVKHPGRNPVDPSLQPPPGTPIGNFASPTGFYHELVEEPQPAQKPRIQTAKSTHRVRKEEPVFSGPKDSKSWSDHSGRPRFASRHGHHRHRHTNMKRHIFRHTMISAVVIGTFCYVTGVTVELIRSRQQPAGENTTTQLAVQPYNNHDTRNNDRNDKSRDTSVRTQNRTEQSNPVATATAVVFLSSCTLILVKILNILRKDW